MSTPFQNRLIGTVIVAAAAIIFLPDLLNGKKVIHEERFAVIPSAPSADKVTKIKKFPEQKLAKLRQEKIYDEEPQDEQLLSIHSNKDSEVKVTTIAKAENFKTLASTAKTSKTNLGKTKITNLTSAGHTKDKTHLRATKAEINQTKTQAKSSYAWVIQLGSFREQHNVNNLMNILKKNGYSTFTKPIKTRHGKLIKVFVGPELSKASLEKQLPKLKKLTKMQGKVTRFKPAQ